MEPEAAVDPQSLPENQQRWLEHLQAAEQAGGTFKDYAQSHGLSVKKLYQWRRDFKARGITAPASPKVSFTPVQVLDTRPTASIRIHLPNGVQLEVEDGISAETLSALFDCLQRRP